MTYARYHHPTVRASQSAAQCYSPPQPGSLQASCAVHALSRRRRLQHKLPEPIPKSGRALERAPVNRCHQIHQVRRLLILQCQIRNIPYGTIAATSWRPFHFGKGVKPPEGNDWKDLAIEYAQHENIALPSTKAEPRDAAEAIGVCNCWHNCAIPEIKWMQQRFIDLRTGAYQHKRSAAA